MRVGLDLSWLQNQFAGANGVAVWGAVVATGLAALRVIEFFRDRSPQLEVTCMWRGYAEAGNDVLLINHGRVPVSIYHFSLVWCRPSKIGSPVEVYGEFDLHDDFSNIVVPPFSTHSMNFSEGEHFSNKPPKGHADARLYLKAWMVGRKKPVFRQVFAQTALQVPNLWTPALDPLAVDECSYLVPVSHPSPPSVGLARHGCKSNGWGPSRGDQLRVAGRGLGNRRCRYAIRRTPARPG